MASLRSLVGPRRVVPLLVISTAVLLSLIYMTYGRIDGTRIPTVIGGTGQTKPPEQQEQPQPDPQSQPDSLWPPKPKEPVLPGVAQGDNDPVPASDMYSSSSPSSFVATLPGKYIPTDQPGAPRLIVIGDVHGQLDALEHLLLKIPYTPSRGDHVIFAGDMINKGPDSAGVVDVAMKIGASAVRGNHEDRVLGVWAKYGPKGHKRSPPLYPGSTGADDDDEENYGDYTESHIGDLDITKGEAQALATAQSLTSSQRDWIAKLPYIIDLGQVPNHGKTVVVHAGVVPGVALESQDPWAVMNMRSLVSPTTVSEAKNVPKDSEALLAALEALKATPEYETKPSADVINNISKIMSSNGLFQSAGDAIVPLSTREGERWADSWERAQEELAAGASSSAAPTTVIFGHDAKLGLQKRNHSYGIDTGCAKGKDLTAMVYEPAFDITSEDVLKAKRDHFAEAQQEKKDSPSYKGYEANPNSAPMPSEGKLTRSVVSRFVKVKCEDPATAKPKGKTTLLDLSSLSSTPEQGKAKAEFQIDPEGKLTGTTPQDEVVPEGAPLPPPVNVGGKEARKEVKKMEKREKKEAEKAVKREEKQEKKAKKKLEKKTRE